MDIIYCLPENKNIGADEDIYDELHHYYHGVGSMEYNPSDELE